MRHRARDFVPVAALALLFAACSERSVKELPIAEAESARALRLTRRPEVIRLSRKSYVEEELAENRSAEGVRAWARIRATAGRLGFFPQAYGSEGLVAYRTAGVGAFFDYDTDTITLFEEESDRLLVHELVHALEDDQFDLAARERTTRSTDEAFARRALVEGDAVLATYRAFDTADPARFAALLSPQAAADRSEQVFAQQPSTPPYFVAYRAFTYSLGTVYAAANVGFYDSPRRFDWAKVDDLIRRNGPQSTQEVLRLGRNVDPIVAVGLRRLPEVIAERYEVDSVDRLGELMISVLLRGAPPGALRLGAWDGDQVVFLRPRDPGEPSAPALPTALVWTSVWDDVAAAEAVAAQLGSLHATPGPEPNLYRSELDGELFRVERRAETVALVKNLPPVDMATLARAALAISELAPLPVDRPLSALESKRLACPRRGGRR